MSYSDILRVKNLGKVIRNPLYQSIVKNGLVLHLDGRDFKNSPPTAIWKDRSGLGNNAIPSGMAYTNVSGSDGLGGVKFDGIDDAISLGTSNVGDSDTFTIETKFIMPTTTSKCILSKCSLLSSARFIIDSAGDGSKLRFFGYTAGGGVAGDTTGITVNIGTLIYGTFIYDGNNFKIYINGIFQKSTPITSTLMPIANNFNIGNRSINGGEIFDSTIKTIKVYNRALTDVEILKNYKASR